LDKIRKHKGFWSFAPAGDRLADKLIQSGNTLCLNEEIFEALDYRGEPKHFFEWLFEDLSDLKMFEGLAHNFSDFEEARATYSESYEILGDKQLTVSEKAILRTLRNASNWEGRTILIGVSTTALAWTDGQRYIAIEREFLKGCRLPSASGCARLINVMIHEMSHDESTMGTHTHGEEFYRRFHDLCMSAAYNAPHRLIADIREKLKDSKLAQRQEKEEAKATREAKKVEDRLGIAASAK